ncbi:glutathione S-transferase family protein [Inmirania thermothiophila]|uniref:Glutathione S-transferase n=1 Tax=Inmirania thermothiophila TaxID=1750597 RepID=A0A3N1Y6W3_9GAMM|nr:glutathione S-transferase family protein [Inmirania thermothiophila]ROR34556.1 glutathione S-transferase [Inmirania thermothiophila]
MNAARPVLYSAAVCPFAHRVRLALAEKGVPCEQVEIDLDAIPDWFRRLSPYGKVPLLVRGEDRVWESAVINEYIEEVWSSPPLMPARPGPRAEVRMWVDHADQHFVSDFYRLLLVQEPERRARIAARLTETLRYMDREGPGAHGGPYWLGGRVTLADLAYYPFFERLGVLEHYRGFRLPEDCRALARWRVAMAGRPAVAACARDLGFYLPRYARYADATVDSDTAREVMEDA